MVSWSADFVLEGINSMGFYINGRPFPFRNRWVWLLVFLFVTGCEAPLNLAGVDRERGRLLHRYDQLQGVAGNGSVLVVVGAGGTILTSSDKGREWQRLQLDGTPSLTGVAACPDGTFGALDPRHKLWVSTDQAVSWEPRKIESPEVPLALTCDPQNRFWVVGGFSTIWVSADQGSTWQENSLGEDAQLTTVQFVDPDFGFITGEFGTVLVTRDSGMSWERVTDLPDEFYPQASLFLDREQGWVVGLNGRVFYTSDSGNSWARRNLDSDTSLFGIVAQGRRLFAVGDNGTLWISDGEGWRSYAHGQSAVSYLRAVHSVEEGVLLVAGGGGALFRVSTTTQVGQESERN
jgi:photosystem II stability/assembly factor-like uncharacterized protein